ncbi:TPA_asm: host cell division inhibitor Icd-like protein [Salmonella enterica subsp. enterica serovar Typhimurium]|nr:host cell division inhibitor Icd-like protein [Salmonella enterica subsp. enterica serovar Typhimurium]
MTYLRLKINHSSPLRKIFSRDILTRLSGLAYCSGVAPHRATGFSSLIVEAGSRLISVKRFFCARKTTCTRLMAGRNGEAFAPAGFFYASLLTLLRLATPFSSVLARLHKSVEGVPAMAKATPCPYANATAHPQTRTQSHQKAHPLFAWRFVSCQSDSDNTPNTYTTTAASEREARLQLPAVRMVFAARIRLKEAVSRV